MNWLRPYIFMAMINTILIIVLNLCLYKIVKKTKATKYFIIAWFLYVLRFLIMLLYTYIPNNILLVFVQITLLTHSYFLFYGVFEQKILIATNKKKNILNFIFILIGFWIITVFLLASENFILFTSAFFLYGLIYIYIGFLFIKHSVYDVGNISLNYKIPGVILILWGIHKIDYPFLRNIDWFAPIGYLLGGFFAFGLAISIFLQIIISVNTKLQNQKSNYEAIYNQASIGIFKTAINGDIISFNKQLTNIFNNNIDFNKNSFLLYNIENKEYFESNIQKLINNKIISFSFEAVINTNNKNPKKFLFITISKFFTNKKEYLLHIVEDRTYRKNIELELMQSQKMELLGSLVSGFAHDFNNILTGIVSTAEVLEDDIRSNVSKKELLESINLLNNSSNRASEMVKHLLELARKNKLSFNYFDLNEVITNLYQITNSSFDKSIKIDFEFDLNTPNIVYGNANQIEQALLNLCINSLHAMTFMRKDEAPGGVLKITISETEIIKTDLLEIT